MKFIIEKGQLSTLTTLVHRAASNKATIPALSGILIEASREKGLTMTATDMEIGIKTSTEQVDIIEEGTVLVNAQYFSDFIKLLPDSPVTISLNHETSKLDITYGRSTGHINIYDNQEHPGLPVKEALEKITLPQKVLREGLKKTAFAAAHNHFRQVFTGVLFDILEDGMLKIVASDTHRLTQYTYMLEEKGLEPFNFIIPIRTINEILRVLDDSEEKISICTTENHVVFQKPRFLLVSRLIEGQYPSYDNVIPGTFKTEVDIDAYKFTTALERARIVPADERIKIPQIQIYLEGQEAVFKTYSEMMGEIIEVIEGVDIKGESPFKIVFNTNYLLEIARIYAGEGEKVNIKFSGSLSPALITNPERDNYLYVIVPLRTSTSN
ncbi:DNA polymerase III, beta subunit [Thermosyntropha lipolytica DSM 11003]|uniref:Beta sliding clamp n=1 Tax=Thermosyntropha lipolytica DSM 11003 TaxID=1123382 RepID=A0A1M5QQW1_9FIRM|nr:DNA polymerase III subunit beta [Thermosyntropha lipolytica]SHH16241.1 DNA polymerase III, beta subunit [Thermosyntropha lipolytica DSM 11003]